jgi:hypothetical protein
MKVFKFAVAAVILASVAACGGGDTDDRVGLADPTVRFVNVAPLANGVTLYRDEVAQSDATNVGFKFASAYFDVSLPSAAWSIRTAAAPVTNLGSVTFAADRGARYTVVALPSATGLTPLLIKDPYDKSLTSNDARFRVVNAATNAPAIDVYLTTPTGDVTTLTPTFPNVQFGQALPPTAGDSLYFAGGSYRVQATTAGTKTVLFSAPVTVAANADWLLLAIPTPDTGTPAAGAIKFLLVQSNTTPVTSEILTAP